MPFWWKSHGFFLKLDSGHMLLQFPFGLQVIFPQSKAALKKQVIPLLFNVPCMKMPWKPSKSFPKWSWRTYRNLYQLSATSSRPFLNTNITPYVANQRRDGLLWGPDGPPTPACEDHLHFFRNFRFVPEVSWGVERIISSNCIETL